MVSRKVDSTVEIYLHESLGIVACPLLKVAAFMKSTKAGKCRHSCNAAVNVGKDFASDGRGMSLFNVFYNPRQQVLLKGALNHLM